jgi:basic membrane protein A
MMKNKTLWIFFLMLLALAMTLSACGGGDEPEADDTAADSSETADTADEEDMEETAADCGSSTGEAEQEGSYQIPTAIEGCYNVAFVYVGPHDDGGWSQAHDVGREYVQENVEDIHTAYVEIVAEGADAEQVVRSLARKGFDIIFTTSFGYMDASATVADEFPDVDIVHISGFQWPIFRSLDHHRVARRQRRAQLCGRQKHLRIPWHDGSHHAQGLAPG